MSMNKLYYGDNLEVLRAEIKDESIDLIYLDPPFNSKANYNILFKSPETGDSAHSQIEAFDDTWHWGNEAQKEYDEIVRSSHTELAELIQALRHFLKENDMMAYLVMMASRLVELHRVLKSTGSLYLHCDPTASHYLKLVLDAIFGFGNFRNEITWKRQSAHSDAKHRFPNISDNILFYAKSDSAQFHPVYIEHDPEYVKKFYRFNDNDGRGLYRLADMASPNPRPNMMYEWKGYPFPAKGWRYEKSTMLKLDNEGRIYYPKRPDGTPDTKKRLCLKRYLSEQEGSIVTNIWSDLNVLSAAATESLGYPTQKPVALLERIISASSQEMDTILDPFCGCGTAVHAAEKLNRKWIGIDITCLSISLIERRIREAFPGVQFEVHGTPKDLESARDLANRDKYQFQWWAISLIGAQPYQGKKKGADSGIDGLIFFKDDHTENYKKIIVSVKGGEHINVAMIRDLMGTIEREKAAIGIFITLTEPTAPMKQEAASAPLYKSPLFPNGIYPTIQILTIEGLLNKTQKPEYPNLYMTDLAFKRTEKETKKQDSQTELF
ncbi:Adenine specific DNA methylase Mod [uncultured Spirochaetota bacterium]|uniref:Adenine specific DNA methylase Mod n=1 Tax=uncultured Spirochaetota bacterium TaxID=460511 RepID=A0A652ZTC2_9SPIR|nr:Adenine specific DNA methylase Mod [uncultured Spirochaetota bacterium]